MGRAASRPPHEAHAGYAWGGPGLDIPAWGLAAGPFERRWGGRAPQQCPVWAYTYTGLYHPEQRLFVPADGGHAVSMVSGHFCMSLVRALSVEAIGLCLSTPVVLGCYAGDASGVP